MSRDHLPRFWRDARMPQVELRSVEDGRSVCYAPHSHREWSIGAITAGQSTFITGARQHRVQTGTLVCVDPDRVHCCNPIEGQSWSYLMMYVDTGWLAELIHTMDPSQPRVWRDLQVDFIQHTRLFDNFCALARVLLDEQASLWVKQSQLVAYFGQMLPAIRALKDRSTVTPRVPANIRQVIRHVDEHFVSPVSLEALSEHARFTPTQLIRVFKRYTGFTPYAYILNRRIEFARHQLKLGKPIVEVALAAGFSDQAHLQRIFKRTLSVTPGQYRDAQPKMSTTELTTSKAAKH